MKPLPINFVRFDDGFDAPEGTYAHVAEVCEWLRINGEDELADYLASMLAAPPPATEYFIG